MRMTGRITPMDSGVIATVRQRGTLPVASRRLLIRGLVEQKEQQGPENEE